MDVLKIEPTRHKAGVLLDPDNHYIEFTGFSLPEDAMAFFLPIINWLYEYSNHCKEYIAQGVHLKVNFKLSYYNSASYRAFLEMFHIFAKMQREGLKVTINWYYEAMDSSMQEGGKDLSDIAKIDINLIEIPEKHP